MIMMMKRRLIVLSLLLSSCCWTLIVAQSLPVLHGRTQTERRNKNKNYNAPPPKQESLFNTRTNDSKIDETNRSRRVHWVPPSVPPGSLSEALITSSPTSNPSVAPSRVLTNPSVAPSRVLTNPSVAPSRVLTNPSVAPSRVLTKSPSYHPDTIAKSPTPSISAMPSIDPLGVDVSKTRNGGREVFTCRRDASAMEGVVRKEHAIRFGYTMILQRGASKEDAMAEGESLLGKGVAGELCQNVEGSFFYLQQLFSEPNAGETGSCPSTDYTDCYFMVGSFKALVYQKVTRRRTLRRLKENSSSTTTTTITSSSAAIEAKFLEVIDRILPQVVTSFATFDSAVRMTPSNVNGFEESDGDDGGQRRVQIVAGVLIG